MSDRNHSPERKKQKGESGAMAGQENVKTDDWKYRAPYKVRDGDADFQPKWDGSCHCGKVKYQLGREKPLASKYCHCIDCKKLHGVSYDRIYHDPKIRNVIQC